MNTEEITPMRVSDLEFDLKKGVSKNERLVLRYPTMQRSGYHSR